MKKPYKCDECQLRFQQEKYLKQHLRHAHSEEKPFQCELCEYRSKYKADIKKHLKTHFPETVVKSFSCSECPLKCTTYANLKFHLMIHTGEKPFVCEFCPYRATKRSTVTRHVVTHTREKPHKCSQCPFACSFLENLKRHVRHLHTDKGARPFPRSFPGCESKFSVNSALKPHILSIHGETTRFKCPSCPKEFDSNTVCEVHIRRHHTKVRRYKCKKCDYTGVTASEVYQHTAFNHGDILGVEYPVCHKAYKNNRSLVSHCSHAHQAQPREKSRIKCDFENCERQFANSSGLRYHIKAFHLKQKSFKCTFCNHSFATSVMLNRHIRTHTGEKPYKCDLCQRCFASSGCLGTHMATAHSESRPFNCDFCDFSTKTKPGLKRHREIHFPVRAVFECAICKEGRGMPVARNQTGHKLGVQYAFRTKSSLVSHMKRHNDERPYKCRLCDYAAKFPLLLRCHFAKVHEATEQMSPSVTKTRVTRLGSAKRNKITTVIGGLVAESSGTSAVIVEKCRPCFVRLVRLNPSTL